MDTRNKPLFHDKYLSRPSLDALHQDAKEWLSDLAFWNDEITFFTKLIRKSFLPLMTKEGLPLVSTIQNEIAELQTSELKELKDSVEGHETRLAEFLKSPAPQKEADERYRRQHRRLEIKIREMTLKIRGLKQQLFSAEKDLLHEEEMKKLTF